MSPFTYCLNTSTIRPTPLLEKVAVAGKAGYQAIEPWNDDVTAFVGQGGSIADLRKATADNGLKVVSVIALHGWLSTEGEEHARAMEECARRMRQAVELGSPYIVASPPREAVDMAKAGERFAALVALGRSLGVEASMEFLGFADGVKTAAGAWEIASAAENATVVADVFHLIRGGGSVDDLLTLPGDRISCFHINDLPADPDPLTQTDADRVMVGEGIADLPRVIANLRTIGYRGPVSLELFNRELWTRDPYEVVKTGLDRIKALVEG